MLSPENVEAVNVVDCVAGLSALISFFPGLVYTSEMCCRKQLDNKSHYSANESARLDGEVA